MGMVTYAASEHPYVQKQKIVKPPGTEEGGTDRVGGRHRLKENMGGEPYQSSENTKKSGKK